MRKLNVGEVIAVVVCVLVVGGFFVSGLLIPSLSKKTSEAAQVQGAASVTTSTNNESATMPINNLLVEDTKFGTGKEAVAGATVTVHYVGTLTDGTKFDSSRDHGTPFSFVLGRGDVIAGWDQGLLGMKVGGIRNLAIPPALAYGSQQIGPIPPNSTLLFEVELLDVK